MAVALGAAAAAFAVTAFAPQVLNDGDTFLHIAAGQRMLAQHAVLFRDPFSYTFAGAPWNAHEWLAEVLMALAYQAGGWSGLIGLFAGAAALTAGLLTYQLGRWLEPQAQAITAVLALSCMTGSLLARPHLLALPLLVIWSAELVRARSESRAPSWWLLPVMTLWVNIHASFLLGLALAGGLALEALTDDAVPRARTLRDWGVFGIGALCACLINPHFVQGIVFPLALMGTSSLAHVDEWQPTDFSHLQPVELVIAAALYVMLSRGVKLSAVRTLILLALLHLTLQHQRHQIVVAAIAPLLLAEPIGRALEFGRERVQSWLSAGMAVAALTLMLGLSVVRLAVPIVRGDGAVAPMSALAGVPQAVRAAPVLNDYSFGGYLIFAGVRPFIDSRAELYGDAALARYAALIRPDPKALDAVIARYGIRWSILNPHSPMVAELDARPGWHRVHSDAFAVVHIRDNSTR
ncbi:MAG TPA: hypothetical protein VHZ78_07715 [Rhizomicrobium sp.]|jgi:hypothetical protein|nr:hypothetical protein [Rhizomicrobium sp.]